MSFHLFELLRLNIHCQPMPATTSSFMETARVTSRAYFFFPSHLPMYMPPRQDPLSKSLAILGFPDCNVYVL